MSARDGLAALLKNTFKTPYLADDWLKQNGPAVLAMYDEVERLREALRFYAAREDCGDIARAALGTAHPVDREEKA